ncbi:hypothetical protein BN9982_1750004 [Mycobacterium tuberculosis]|nr:hypothetical protein BN9982_1750004 [Mycobacterium tuberculosis]
MSRPTRRSRRTAANPGRTRAAKALPLPEFLDLKRGPNYKISSASSTAYSDRLEGECLSPN